MKKVFVLYGGPSVEHSVSINSAKSVLNALDREKYQIYPLYLTQKGHWCPLPAMTKEMTKEDMVNVSPSDSIAISLASFLTSHDFSDGNTIFLSILHGTYGEDGGVQGFFETLDVPYVGCNISASALAMDKGLCNEILEQNGIPQAKFITMNRTVFSNKEYNTTKMVKKLGLPMYVKPSNCGSSVGVVRVQKEEEIEDALRTALQFDDRIVIEEEIWGRELNVSVIGNENPMGSVPGDFEMETGYFDYETKYKDPDVLPIIPAKIPEEDFSKVTDVAVRAYKAIGARGLARVDIFYTEDGDVFVNEINTMPGMSDLSMTPILWGATDGTTYPQLLDKLIDWGFEAYAQKKALVRDYE